MENFITPKKILGTIKVTPKHFVDKYFIGEANLAIEKIGNKAILNLWANSYHYELHNEKEVLVGDVGFEIMQPIRKELFNNEIFNIDFPSSIEKVEDNWEDFYYGHFYQFEHLKISNWHISILQKLDEKLFEIQVKGFITDDIRKISKNHFFESTFITNLETKINSKFNWDYSSGNQNAKNKN